jgi:hypothetical protein
LKIRPCSSFKSTVEGALARTGVGWALQEKS